MAWKGKRDGARPLQWAVRLLGLMLALIGLSLVIGGAQLVMAGGSPYYLVAGAGMIVSGGMLIALRAVGGWIYVAVYAATLVWALWEVGLQGWPLVPRVVGPSLLMVLVLPAILVLAGSSRQRRQGWAAVAGFALVIVGGGALLAAANRPQPAEATPTADLTMSDPSLAMVGDDWPAYGGTYSARRFSPLNEITPENVGRLERAWVANTGDLPSPAAAGRYAAETTPLKVGDTLYLCSAKNILIALDPATGRQRWRYDPKVGDEWIPNSATCRGVNYHVTPGAAPAQACAARIIEGTLDSRLIAVDARTGRPCEDFGVHGEVDTKLGMGRAPPGSVAITSPPTIVRGVVVVGHHVPDDGRTLDAPSGVIQGYDAVTGALKWAWDMGQPDRAGVPGPGETYTPGTPNMWTAATGDEALGLVYLPLANSAVDHWSSTRRPADNRYSTSLVALDVTSGRPAWSFQTVHKDVWDYDLGSQATLIDFPGPGGPTPALVLPSKQGDLYVLDRRTGRALTGVAELAAPQGGGEPAARAKTQPASLFHTLRKPVLTERDMWGMSPIDQMLCRLQFRRADYRGPYTPPSADRPSVQYPGSNGGSDWGGVTVEPQRGVIVANYSDVPNYNRLVKLGVSRPNEAPYGINVNPGWTAAYTGLPCKQPPYGGIRAVDLRTGKTIWDRPLGDARRDGPFGIGSRLPIDIGTPNNGGSVVTAGGLIFISASTDDMIRAIDLKTGKTLWKDRLPAGGQATPMTYRIGGRQYVVIMAGGHHLMGVPIGDALIAYALPAR